MLMTLSVQLSMKCAIQLFDLLDAHQFFSCRLKVLATNFHIENSRNALLDVVGLKARASAANTILLDNFRKPTVGRCMRKNRALGLNVSGNLDRETGSPETLKPESLRVHRIDEITRCEHWQCFLLQ